MNEENTQATEATETEEATVENVSGENAEKETEKAAETPAKEVEKAEEKTVKEAETPKAKTFTQSEVDEIVKKRLARASKDTQVAAAENVALKNSIACYKAGVKAESIEDAIALATKYVDDNTDFDAALAKVLEKYPAFAGVTTVKNSSPDMQSKPTVKSDEKLRKIMQI